MGTPCELLKLAGGIVPQCLESGVFLIFKHVGKTEGEAQSYKCKSLANHCEYIKYQKNETEKKITLILRESVTNVHLYNTKSGLISLKKKRMNYGYSTKLLMIYISPRLLEMVSCTIVMLLIF